MSNNKKEKMSVSEASWRIRRHAEETKEKHSSFFQKGRKAIGMMGTLGKKAVKTSGSIIREVAKETKPFVREGGRYSARVSSQMRSSSLFGGGAGWGSFDRPARKPHKRGGSRTITIRLESGQVRQTKKRSHKKRKETRQPFSLF
jgi:hypothetical protein